MGDTMIIFDIIYMVKFSEEMEINFYIFDVFFFQIIYKFI